MDVDREVRAFLSVLTPQESLERLPKARRAVEALRLELRQAEAELRCLMVMLEEEETGRWARHERDDRDAAGDHPGDSASTEQRRVI